MKTVDIELSLPLRTLSFIDNICAQSHQSRDTVVNVLLAASLSSSRGVTDDGNPEGAFTTPDCPTCGCVDDGACLCRPATAPKPDVQTSEPITPDVYLRDTRGTLVVSYGPRRLAKDNCVEPCHESKAQFWGVYEHHLDTGEAKIMFDVVTKDDAMKAARLFVHMIDRNHEMQWRVEASTATARNKVARIVELESDVARLNDEVLEKQHQINNLRSLNRQTHSAMCEAEWTLSEIEQTLARVRT